VLTILKQISKGNETAKIHGNIDENVFLQNCEKLWNTTNINELKLEWDSDNRIDIVITSDELEKNLKVNKKWQSPGEDNSNSVMQVPPEEFILRLLQCLNNIYTKNCIANEGKNAVVILVFKKVIKRPKKLQMN
jgi:hypothetical protein